MANYTYLRREFLNPAETTYSSFVLVHVEDSERGTRAHGSNIVNIADCHRVTTFDFYLGNQAARDSSIAKINLLLEILGEFRDALVQEAYLITKVEKESNEEASESFSEDKIQKRGGRPRTKPRLLATKLRAIREKRNMSQSEFVKALDVKISTARISEYELGKREPDLLLLRRYASLAEIPVEALIDDTDVSLLDIQNSE